MKTLIKTGALAAAVAVSASCWEAPPTSSNIDPANYRTAVGNDNKKEMNDKKPDNSKPANSNTEKTEKKGFMANLPDGFEKPSDSVGEKLLREYGAVFVAQGVKAPRKVVFRDSSDVSSFQAEITSASETMRGLKVELQSAAMEDLKKAIVEASSNSLSITPPDTDSARRSYDETIKLWKSRVDPALKHWVGKGRMTKADADRIAAMSPFEQVSEVLKLEENGIFFAKDLSKSIIYSVAPPGTSQHLSMLALDVKEHGDQKVRDILARHKWYQTVVSDLPHFTYLGVEESKLASLGLKRVTDGGRTFWLPDL